MYPQVEFDSVCISSCVILPLLSLLPAYFVRLRSAGSIPQRVLQTLAWRDEQGGVNGHADIGASAEYPAEFCRTVGALHSNFLTRLSSGLSGWRVSSQFAP